MGLAGLTSYGYFTEIQWLAKQDIKLLHILYLFMSVYTNQALLKKSTPYRVLLFSSISGVNLNSSTLLITVHLYIVALKL